MLSGMLYVDEFNDLPVPVLVPRSLELLLDDSLSSRGRYGSFGRFDK